MEFTDTELNIDRKYDEIFDRNTSISDNFNYYLEIENEHVQSPEELLLAKEDAFLAGEEFEGSPYPSNLLGYKTPHSSEEVIHIFARKKIRAHENMLFHQINLNSDICKSENRYKDSVRKRQKKIEELLPRMMNLYSKYKPEKAS